MCVLGVNAGEGQKRGACFRHRGNVDGTKPNRYCNLETGTLAAFLKRSRHFCISVLF